MMKQTGAVLLIGVLLAGCGGSSPTAPTPAPSPTPTPAPTSQAVTVALLDTVTGASIGSSTHTVGTFPAQLTFLVPGYVQRHTWVRSNMATVDLIPEAGFDLTFYRQFARNAINAPSNLESLRVLRQAPSVYLQTTGLSAATVRAFDDAIRNTVFEMSGRSFGVVALEHGSSVRAPSSGWIVVDLVNDEMSCGRALVGSEAGHVWLNTASRCSFAQYGQAVLAHEIGHALGFFHVSNPDALMFSVTTLTAPSAIERYHAAIAYKRQRGNQDVDTDPLTAGLSAPQVVVD